MDESLPQPPPESHVPKPIQADPGAPPNHGAPAEDIEVCLTTTDRGYAQLTWASASPDDYDWVGLFLSPSDADTAYLTSGWQWAKSASSYDTSWAIEPGYQARYLRWDKGAGAYKALLRTSPFPDRVQANSYDMRNWMSRIVDTTKPLSQISLPGTHDSAAWGMYLPATNTQTLSIGDQLRAGVRFLDIRLGLSSGALYLYHGSVYLLLSFDDVLGWIDAFLVANPMETVVMSIKNEGTASDDFANVLKSRYIDANPSRYWVSDLVPTVQQAQGKIVLVRRFGLPAGGFPKGLGLDFSNGWSDNAKNATISYRSRVDPAQSVTGHVQDFYDTSDVAAKAQAVGDMLTMAEKGKPTDIFLNFSSAVGWYNPYGMAVAVNPKLYTSVTGAPTGSRLGWVPMDYPDSTLWLTYRLAVSNLPAKR